MFGTDQQRHQKMLQRAKYHCIAALSVIAAVFCTLVLMNSSEEFSYSFFPDKIVNIKSFATITELAACTRKVYNFIVL